MALCCPQPTTSGTPTPTTSHDHHENTTPRHKPTPTPNTQHKPTNTHRVHWLRQCSECDQVACERKKNTIHARGWKLEGKSTNLSGPSDTHPHTHTHPTPAQCCTSLWVHRRLSAKALTSDQWSAALEFAHADYWASLQRDGGKSRRMCGCSGVPEGEKQPGRVNRSGNKTEFEPTAGAPWIWPSWGVKPGAHIPRMQSSPPSVDKQCRQFPPESPNQCGHPQVPTATFAEPLCSPWLCLKRKAPPPPSHQIPTTMQQHASPDLQMKLLGTSKELQRKHCAKMPGTKGCRLNTTMCTATSSHPPDTLEHPTIFQLFLAVKPETQVRLFLGS